MSAAAVKPWTIDGPAVALEPVSRAARAAELLARAHDWKPADALEPVALEPVAPAVALEPVAPAVCRPSAPAARRILAALEPGDTVTTETLAALAVILERPARKPRTPKAPAMSPAMKAWMAFKPANTSGLYAPPDGWRDAEAAMSPEARAQYAYEPKLRPAIMLAAQVSR